MMRLALMQTLRQYRDELTLSRDQLAFKTGMQVTASTIYRIEIDDVVPEQKTRDALAAALKLSPDEIEWPTPERVALAREERERRKAGGKGDAQ